jgi:hypothetical protein
MKTITVGDLKKTIENIPDNVEVLISIPLRQESKINFTEADGFTIGKTYFSEKDPIGGTNFNIQIGQSFLW